MELLSILELWPPFGTAEEEGSIEIKDAEGNSLGFVESGSSVIIGLVDNSTAAGQWVIMNRG